MIGIDKKIEYDSVLIRERERIARAMHDDLAQYLTALALHTKAISIVSRNEDVLMHTNQINNLIANSRLNIKHIIWNLLEENKSEGVPFSLKIKKLLDYWNLADDTIEQNLKIIGNINNLADVIISLSYKAIQETITNIYRHANASSFKLTLINHDGYLEVTIEDDGIGFDNLNTHYSDGIKGIIVRLKNVDGNINIHSDVGLGTHVYMKIPLLRRAIS